MEKGFNGSASHGNNKQKSMRYNIWETITSLISVDHRTLEIGIERKMNQITKFGCSFYFMIEVDGAYNRF